MKVSKGCVYFFRHLGLSPVKIGYSESQSPKSRFDQFKTYAPYGCEMLGFVSLENSKKVETELHKKHASKRLKGEWFEITAKEVETEILYYSSFEEKLERSSFWEKYSNEKYVKFDVNKNENVFDQVLLDFIDDIDYNVKMINRKEMLKNYIEYSGIEITPQKFYKKVQEIFIFKNIEYKMIKYNGTYVFKFPKLKM